MRKALKNIISEDEMFLHSLNRLVKAGDYDCSDFAQKMVNCYMNNHEWTQGQKEAIRKIVNSRIDDDGKLKQRDVCRKKQAYDRGYKAGKNGLEKKDNFYAFLGRANKELRSTWDDGWGAGRSNLFKQRG